MSPKVSVQIMPFDAHGKNPLGGFPGLRKQRLCGLGRDVGNDKSSNSGIEILPQRQIVSKYALHRIRDGVIML
jgi:hypothetical protein